MLNFNEFKEKAIKSIINSSNTEIKSNYYRYSQIANLCKKVKGLSVELHIIRFRNGYPVMVVRIAKDSLPKKYIDAFVAERERLLKNVAWFTEYRGETWQKILCNVEELKELKLSKSLYGECWSDEANYIYIPTSKIKI